MIYFYLKNFFNLKIIFVYKKNFIFSHPTDYFYFPRPVFNSFKLNFSLALKILKGSKNFKISRGCSRSLYGYIKKKNFIKLCRFNFMKFFFFGFMPYRFNTFVRRTKSYNFQLLNLFFFNSIGHILNLFPLNNFLFLYNSYKSLFFTINGGLSKGLWAKLQINDIISLYWSDFTFIPFILFTSRNNLYIKWVTYNKYNWSPLLYTYILFLDFRQNITIFQYFIPSFSKKNAFNFNTFSLYNWKFVT